MPEDVSETLQNNEKKVEDRKMSKDITDSSNSSSKEFEVRVKSPDDLTEWESEEDMLDEDEYTSRRGKISLSTCTKVAYVTQLLVVALALTAFSLALSSSLVRLKSRHILESKQSISQDEPWFKLAICLRPFFTPSALDEFYQLHFKKKLKSHIDGLKKPTSWSEKTWLDVTLQPKSYTTYFQKVHPWDKIPASELWTYQNNSFRKAFQEFKVNKLRLTSKVNGPSAWTDEADNSYTVLTTKKEKGSHKADYALLGHYSLSPFYAGCLNITVNESMSKRQMEVDVRVKNTVASKLARNDPNSKRIVLFKAADLFVYDATDVFTEIPIIQKFSKFSIHSNTLERLLVKGFSYHRKRSEHKHCRDNKGYSQTNCRQWCIARKLLETVECILPWMQDMVQKPWMDERLQNLAVCTDSVSFLQTLAIQDKYFQSNEANLTRPVIDCLKSCPDRCSAFKVNLLSLGSKSIGSNYGISLTISPEVESVTEQFDYTFLNMVAELSASISFLLGLSAIAIYDWLIALGIWAAAKLGLNRCGGHKDDESTSTASSEAPTPPIPPVLRVPSHVDGAAPAAARHSGGIGPIWHLEPDAAKAGGNKAASEGKRSRHQHRRSGVTPVGSGPASPEPAAGGPDHATPSDAFPEPDPAA